MIRRKTNRRHMTGDHHGRAAGRATLLVTPTDEILGTHSTSRCCPARCPGQPGTSSPIVTTESVSLITGVTVATCQVSRPHTAVPAMGHRRCDSRRSPRNRAGRDRAVPGPAPTLRSSRSTGAARAAGNLAADLRALGEIQAAWKLDQDTLAGRRRVLGEDHPSTLTSASNLAADLRALGEIEAAWELDVDTLNRCRRVLGEDHPDTLRSASNLADDLCLLAEVPAAAM